MKRTTLCWAAPGRRYLCLCHVFLLVNCCVQGGDVTCQTRSEDVTAQANGTVYLPCAFSYNGSEPSLLKVSWQTEVGNKTIVVHAENSKGFRADTQDKRFRNHTRMSADWINGHNATLRISQVLQQFSGTFQCLVRASQRSEECASVKLTVSVLPE
eukprot:gi/632988186/ref/XP_007882969.1/ PREDICTED: uncharacterized protein LOC103171980 isoform X2 [Callorhinchus milii]